MTTLPVLGPLLTAPGWVVAAVLVVITPGVHLILSATIENRRVNLTDDYPAVLFGDPLLAAAAGLGIHMADGDLSPLAHWRYGLLAIVTGVLFGAWQSRSELAEGRYTLDQIRSVSKRFHQYVVYPVLGYVVPVSVASGLRAWDPVLGTVMVLAGVVWMALVVEAWTHPRVGHGTWPPAPRVGHAPTTH
jgi:hypothetical protein